MNASDSPGENILDARLSAAFRGLDTRPGFDAQVMSRIEAESRAGGAEERQRARQAEQRRYLAARQELRRRGSIASILSSVTFHRLGLVALGAALAVAAWTTLGPQIEQAWGAPWVVALKPYAPGLLAALGSLLVLTPILVSEARRQPASHALDWGI